jgi:hypothetical protein
VLRSRYPVKLEAQGWLVPSEGVEYLIGSNIIAS